MNSVVARAATVVAVTCAGLVPAAQAAEGGTGNYLLGKRGSLAAFVPKPGWYLTNDIYFMSGDRSQLTPLGDRVVGNVDAEALVNVAQVTWVADASVLSGSLGWKKRTGDRFRAWSGYASVYFPTGD